MEMRFLIRTASRAHYYNTLKIPGDLLILSWIEFL